MAFEIPDHFHKSFTTNVELLLQQKKFAYDGAIDKRMYTGEAAQVVKQFGEVEFNEVTSRNRDTVWSDIQHKQRWVFPTDYDLALPVDKEDELRMLDSPLSSYAEAMRAAWARKLNSIVRTAALGAARTGTSGGTSTAFDTTNFSIASGSAGLTIAKLREAREKLRAAHNDESDPLFIAVKAEHITDLLETTEVTSSDFNTVKALVQGEVDTFMGFKFIHDENLAQVSSEDAVFAWAKSGIVLGQWNGLETIIGQRADKAYTTQVFMRGTVGATRTNESKIVRILCA
jgi:hypothetical protein